MGYAANQIAELCMNNLWGLIIGTHVELTTQMVVPITSSMESVTKILPVGDSKAEITILGFTITIASCEILCNPNTQGGAKLNKKF